ncbi:PREDICTED: putative nuclease HARBI1 [Rhagoletis zephyria]|uniref:putative nuclease HARBI1 n=1 Tax=Rhagoletis zephyria TaxID=28612 RepID=UPI0008119DC8|nr:PREDICTED: putative nuclease HARBI1 [Rhagoletis zephyria]
MQDEELFYKLILSLLKEKMQRVSRRPAIDIETRFSVTLLYFAQGCNVQVLGWAYKLGISTVRKIIYETCEALCTELGPIYVSTPNVTEFEKIANDFYLKTGLPNCVGAIDDKHIYMYCPRRSGSLYFNYKQRFSITLLAVCDADYTFTYVDVGAFGCQSDGGIFSRTAFGKEILNGTLEMPPDRPLPNTSINFQRYFVADNAFSLKRNLMRPFPGHFLPTDKEIFNRALSQARVYIENAFVVLANRWRVLHTCMQILRTLVKLC